MPQQQKAKQQCVSMPQIAVQVQWQHMTVPHISAATQGFNGDAVTDWECVTLATYFHHPLSHNLQTHHPPNQPLYIYPSKLLYASSLSLVYGLWVLIKIWVLNIGYIVNYSKSRTESVRIIHSLIYAAQFIIVPFLDIIL